MIRVLIVDDEELARGLVREFLNEEEISRLLVSVRTAL